MTMRVRISAIAIAFAGMAASAQADYYVLPYAQLEALLYDPITQTLVPQPGYQVENKFEANGVTFQQASRDDGLRQAFASVNLDSGELKVSASARGDTRRASANAIFGDTVTIIGGAGTYWDFSFGLDGFYELEFGEPNLEAPPTLGTANYDVTLAVYRPGITTFNGWSTTDTAKALFFESINDTTNSFDRDTPEIGISEWMSHSILLESDRETFEVYARIVTGAGTSIYDGITYIHADFSQTARLDFQFDSGVAAYADSGALLGLMAPPPIPEPETYALMLAGLGLVGWAASRRRKVGV